MRWVGYLVAAVVCAVGCGGSGIPVVPVNGIVMLDDKPLEAATVTFYPEDQNGVGGTARTGTDGKFVILGVKGDSGLLPGKYKVTVSKLPPIPDEAAVGAVTEVEMRQDFPPIYSNPNLTVLSYSVLGDGKPIEIKLDSTRKR